MSVATATGEDTTSVSSPDTHHCAWCDHVLGEGLVIDDWDDFVAAAVARATEVAR